MVWVVASSLSALPLTISCGDRTCTLRQNGQEISSFPLRPVWVDWSAWLLPRVLPVLYVASTLTMRVQCVSTAHVNTRKQ